MAYAWNVMGSDTHLASIVFAALIRVDARQPLDLYPVALTYDCESLHAYMACLFYNVFPLFFSFLRKFSNRKKLLVLSVVRLTI